MKKWLHEGRELKAIEDFPADIVGFVYKITHKASGKIYIGKKSLYSKQNKPLTKTEIAQWSKPGRVPKKKKVIKESDWLSYWGSNKPLQKEVKESGEDQFTREIIVLCKSKKQMSYYEMYWQMNLNVLAINSYNDNIGGKFYRKDLE